MKRLGLRLLAFICAPVLFAQEAPRLVTDAEAVVETESCFVKAAIRGAVASVESTFVFFNPGGRVLEGELVFPLPDGAVVTGYALDVDGAMTDGVVVPKDEARIAFETETRRGIDPGIAEQVGGNLYRTRIYPLPASGRRTARISYVAPVFFAGGGASFHLPMPRERIGRREIEIEVLRHGAEKPRVSGLGRRDFEEAESFWRIAVKDEDAVPGENVIVALPALPENFEHFERGKDGIVRKARVRPHGPKAIDAKEEPVTYDIYWDASGSRSPSPAEFSLLEILSKSSKRETKFRLRVFRNEAEPFREFADAASLVACLESIKAYDGATSFEGVFDRDSPNVKILFSDGFETMGREAPPPVEGLLAVTSSSAADFGLLRRMAPLGVARLHGVGKDDLASIERLVAPCLEKRNSPLEAAGEYEISLGEAVLSLSEASPADGSTAVAAADALASLWVSLKMEELSCDPQKNRDEILRLGRQYSIAGPGTSLIVLESLDQYLRYAIEPPESLPRIRDEWQRAMKRTGGGNSPETILKEHMKLVESLWKERLEWWERDYEKNPLEAAKPEPRTGIGRLARFFPRAVQSRASEPEANGGMELFAMESSPMMEASVKDAQGAMDAPKPRTSAISIKPWDSAAPYMEAIRKADGDGKYAAYLKERETYRNSPSFYLDSSEHFFREGMDSLAMRILSNLAEIAIGDASLLRAFAFELRDEGVMEEAIAQFRRVTLLSPESGDGFRNLALALSQEAKNRFAKCEYGLAERLLGEAFGIYRKVAFTPWQRNADALSLFAIEEFNALASWTEAASGEAGGKFGFVPPKLGGDFDKAISCDLRVVLEWNYDNVDLDLHVIEPDGAVAYYANRFTRTGGMVSRDVTDGFGPEEYMVRKASKGEYAIETNYFASHAQRALGPVAATATVYTGWGRKDEKSRMLTLRLDKPAKGKVRIGAVEYAE